MLDDMGYAKVTIDGEELLFVCSRTVQNAAGTNVALNSTVYVMDGKEPVECGVVYTSSEEGLRLADGCVYCGSEDNTTYTCYKYDKKASYLNYAESVWKDDYDMDGNKTETPNYYCDNVKNNSEDCASDEATFQDMVERYNKATPIEFTVVHN